MTHATSAQGLKGTNPPPPYIGLTFGSVHQLLAAGNVLKETGLSFLVALRRIHGCGVLLLIGAESTPTALSLLSSRGIEPREVVAYVTAESPRTGRSAAADCRERKRHGQG